MTTPNTPVSTKPTKPVTPRWQVGTWTLTAPDGRTWTADSPLKTCGLEQRERVPTDIGLQRIFAACRDVENLPPDDHPPQTLDEAIFEVIDWLEHIDPEDCKPLQVSIRWMAHFHLKQSKVATPAPSVPLGGGEAKRGTDAQILFERKLTCEAIEGAMAFGYEGSNPPPEPTHWLAQFWELGRYKASLEDRVEELEAALQAQDAAPVATQGEKNE